MGELFSARRAVYSHGQHEYSVPPGLAPAKTQASGACWYSKTLPSPEGMWGGPPHATAYSFGAHMFVHVAAPAHPEQSVGSSERQMHPAPEWSVHVT